MITSMRRCVAYNDLWPWPISSRSFGLDLENRVLSVASTVLDGFFPYVVQMITSMRRCVACDDLWPWPISSRSFGLDLENRVLSVASTVLDGFFPYLVQMISSMRRCVACDDLWPWPISSRSFDLDFENRVRSVTFSVLDRLFFWLGIQYDSIMWVIMRPRGVSSERRRSSYSSYIPLDCSQMLQRIRNTAVWFQMAPSYIHPRLSKCFCSLYRGMIFRIVETMKRNKGFRVDVKMVVSLNPTNL